jgi:hypothetical protein
VTLKAPLNVKNHCKINKIYLKRVQISLKKHRSNRMNQINVKALCLSLGITCGASMLFLGWIGGLFGWGGEAVDVAASFYLGFNSTFWGGIAGAIWGFVDGVIGGYVIARLYNFFLTSKMLKKIQVVEEKPKKRTKK